MGNWKFIAGAALLAGFLSLAAGIFSGSPFIIILLRMVLSSLVFGGISVGVIILVKRFLPELLKVNEISTAAGGVDILIPEENPHQAVEEEGDEVVSSPALEREDLDGSSLETEKESDEEADLLEAVSESDDGIEEKSSDSMNEKTEEDTSMPDIEQLDVGFEADVDSLDHSLDHSVQKSGSGADSFAGAQVDGLVDNQDPAILAKAVRTFMNKDQEE